MKIEKLTEDKIRITLNLEDLESKNIDLHSFMANSKETQNLFGEMLDKLEKEIGFVTKNYRLSVEAIATQAGTFVLTITRLLDPNLISPKKIHIKRKSISNTCSTLIYKFDNFDDLCLLCEFIKKNDHLKNIVSILDNVSLYYYNNYYIVIKNINLEIEILKNICSVFSEFGKYINNPILFEKKLQEYGKLVLAEGTIDCIIKKFVH